MLLTKHNLSVVEFAQSDHSRPMLNTVCVEKGRTVATDSYCLAMVEPLASENVADYPAMAGIKPRLKPKTTLLPAELVARMIKSLPTKTSLPILEDKAVITKEPKGQVGLASTNLEVVRHFSAPEPEGEFPEYKKILPKTKGAKMMYLNPKYLKKMATWLEKINSDKCGVILTNDPLAPLAFVATSYDTHQDAVGLIMPMRV